MTKTKITAIITATVLVVGSLYIGSNVLPALGGGFNNECPGVCPIFEPQVRDNTTVTHINLEWPQKLILVDNAGIGGISDVEVTWRFDPSKCMVQTLPSGVDPSLEASWDLLPNDMVFGAFAAHADAFDVEAVALSAVSDDDECELDDDDGEFVTVSTVFALPPEPF